ncbi:MAG: PHP domain-containing protein [Clostridia bacterium]|nr:PHP domain-containing protein [Clostridia bacterium]
MYKIELHLHTRYSSGCSLLEEKEIIAGYKAAGYSGIVVTDHFNRDTYRMLDIDPDGPGEKLDRFFLGYRKLKEEGEKQGIRVYKGVELRFDENYNDYLFLGFSDDLIADPGKIFPMTPMEFADYHRPTGSLLIQAHPFRWMCTPADPRALDGVEVMNRHPGHDSRNHLALEMAEQNPHLIRTGGSDTHETHHMCRGGIVAKVLPKDEKELVALLRSGDYTIIQPE